MKSIHILIIALFTLISLQTVDAQNRMGIKVEYGINSITQQSIFAVSANNHLDYNINLIDVSPSQSIGVYSNFRFGYLFLQPEALYTSYSVRYQVEKFNDRRNAQIKDVTEKIEQFDIPVFAGVRYKALKFGAGPVFHIGEQINSDFEGMDKIDINPTKLSAGLQLGVGIDFKILSLDVKYQKEFNQISDHLNFNQGRLGLKSRLSGIKIGMAISIGR